MQKNREQQEQKWIKRIKLFGSKKDADQLVGSYYDEIYIFVLRQINDAETALDLTQDIFIAVLQSISAYKKEMAGLGNAFYKNNVFYGLLHIPGIEVVIAGVIALVGVVVNTVNYKTISKC